MRLRDLIETKHLRHELEDMLDEGRGQLHSSNKIFVEAYVVKSHWRVNPWAKKGYRSRQRQRLRLVHSRKRA